jgi:Glycosyl transferase family 2
MRLVQTLVVRDEVDVVGEQLAYHLAAGVDFVIATDNGSRDGTLELLERYERDGVLRLIRESGPIEDGRWRTRMARLAATEHGADWVINTDADEFWMPRRGTLKEAFAAVPAEYGVIWAVTRHFVPRPDDDRPFSERMTVRFASAGAALNDPTSPYRPHGKAAHRADPQLVVRYGSHRVTSRLAPLPHWHPADVLHFPFRSLEQYERKTVRRAHSDSRLAQYVRGFHARERGRVADVFGSLVVDDVMRARGLAAGSLVEDTRLRDALRGSTRQSAADGAATGVAVDTEAFREAEIVRLVRFVDDLSARVAAVERRARARRG